MRKDLKRMGGALKQIKNPNFNPPEENIMESSTTYVDVKPKNTIGDTNIANVANKPASGADKPLVGKKSGPQTWKPSQMWKDTKKGLSMLLGYSDKVMPTKRS